MRTSLYNSYSRRRAGGAGETEWQAARDIATALGGLPLALELAGAYLRYWPVDWQQYRDLLRTTSGLLCRVDSSQLASPSTKLTSTPRSRFMRGFLEEEPRLRQFLDLLTWSGPAPMGQSLLCALLNVVNSTELTNALGPNLPCDYCKKLSMTSDMPSTVLCVRCGARKCS